MHPYSMELCVRPTLRSPHGTRIEISHLTSTWSKKKVDEVYRDLLHLQSIFSLGEDDAESEDSFEVLIYRNGDYEPFADARQQDLSDLLQNRAVFHIEGRFDASAESFEFTIDGQSQAIERSEEQTSELQSLMRSSYAVFCLKTKNNNIENNK